MNLIASHSVYYSHYHICMQFVFLSLHLSFDDLDQFAPFFTRTSYAIIILRLRLPAFLLYISSPKLQKCLLYFYDIPTKQTKNGIQIDFMLRYFNTLHPIVKCPLVL